MTDCVNIDGRIGGVINFIENHVKLPDLVMIRSPQVCHQVGNFLGSCNDLIVCVVPLLHLEKEGW